MRTIAIAQISLVWLTTCSTYYVIAAPMQGLVEVPLKAGCPCGHDAGKIQPLVQNSPATVVGAEREVIESGCQGAHDHDHEHGPGISNRPTPPPSNKKHPTSGSCANGCDHHDGPVVIPNSDPTPPISKEMSSTQASCGSGCGHDHGPVIPNKPAPAVSKKEMLSTQGSCGSGCDHHHGPPPVIATKPSTPSMSKEKPTTNSSCKSGCHDHDHPGASDPHSHNVSQAPDAGGCDHDHHHGPSQEDWEKTVEYRFILKVKKWYRQARDAVGRWFSKVKEWANRRYKPKKV